MVYDGHQPENPGDFTSVEQTVDDAIEYLKKRSVTRLNAAYGCSLGGARLTRLLALGVLRSLGRISDYRIDDRRERLLPLLVGAVCYVLCAITIAKIPSAIFLRKFMIAAACCEVMCLVVSLYWKISLHLTAMGAVVALLVVMNIAGVGDMMVPLMIAILCAGALASARLYLGCHNGQQVLAGFCGGFAVAALAVLFL